MRGRVRGPGTNHDDAQCVSCPVFVLLLWKAAVVGTPTREMDLGSTYCLIPLWRLWSSYIVSRFARALKLNSEPLLQAAYP